MKNKLIKILFIFLLNFSFLGLAISEEFTFEVTEVEITENGNVYRGNNTGKITTEDGIEIKSDNFRYLKITNSLEVDGSAQLIDFRNDIIINAEKIFYIKNDERIYTLGNTTIKISDEYDIQGYDLTLLKDKMILSSNKKVVIKDNFGNIYKLDEFVYSINHKKRKN